MTVAYEGHGVTVHIADALDVLAGIADASVDAVVTDPPYGLEFMGKEWDAPWKQGADVHAEARNRRAEEMGDENKRRYIASAVNKYAAGLPFQQWCELWAVECLRVLKPGGHLLAFGGTRTWHRLACAVEDAGFEVRDSIAWMYGSGFPKSLDVSKAIDKRREEDRAPVDAVRSWLNARRLDAGLAHDAVNKHFGHASNGGGSSSAWMTNPTSKSLPTWDQWQELKSLFGFGDDMDAEVWRLNGRKGKPGDNYEAREVLSERVTEVKGGSWAAEVATGRFRLGEKVIQETAPATDAAREWQGWGTALKPAFEPVVVARKPLAGTVAATVLAHGTGALNIDGCRIGLASGEDVAALNARSGGRRGFASEYVGGTDHPLPPGADLSKGRWPANVVLDESQAEALDEQSGEASFNPAGKFGTQKVDSRAQGSTNIGPRGEGDGIFGYGDRGGASRFFYVAKADATERPRIDDTAHPTVKPLDLMRWLVRLVTPPGGLVLDPFAGSGTTAEACILEGFRCVTIDKEPEHLPLILQRINRQRDPVEAIRQRGEDLGLFDHLEGAP